MINFKQEQLTSLFLQSKVQNTTKQNSTSNLDSIHEKNSKLQFQQKCRFKNNKEKVKNQKYIFKEKIKTLQSNVIYMEKKYDRIIFQLSKQIQKNQTKNNKLKFEVLKMKTQLKLQKNQIQVIKNLFIKKKSDQNNLKLTKSSLYNSKRLNKKQEIFSSSKQLNQGQSEKRNGHQIGKVKSVYSSYNLQLQKKVDSKEKYSNSKKIINSKNLCPIMQNLNKKAINKKSEKKEKSSSLINNLISRSQSPTHYKSTNLIAQSLNLKIENLSKSKSQTFLKKPTSFSKLKFLIS